MPMHITHQQELFSRCFVEAVATVAGHACYELVPDHDKVDLGIAVRGPYGRPKPKPRVEIQIKSLLNEVPTGDHFEYPLDIDTYDNLRTPGGKNYAHILVVVVSPKNVDEWLELSPEQLTLRRCAYWKSLEGEPAVPNKTTRTVKIPTANLFTPEALNAMIARVAVGERP